MRRAGAGCGCNANNGRDLWVGFFRMTDEEMRKRLALLRLDHRDLDTAIAALTDKDGPDQLQVARLKKRKLKLKDQISMFEDYLIPDIIA